MTTVPGVLMSMEKQSELSELSLILWVSAVVGCPLNEVALYNKINVCIPCLLTDSQCSRAVEPSL